MRMSAKPWHACFPLRESVVKRNKMRSTAAHGVAVPLRTSHFASSPMSNWSSFCCSHAQVYGLNPFVTVCRKLAPTLGSVGQRGDALALPVKLRQRLLLTLVPNFAGGQRGGDAVPGGGVPAGGQGRRGARGGGRAQPRGAPGAPRCQEAHRQEAPRAEGAGFSVVSRRYATHAGLWAIGHHALHKSVAMHLRGGIPGWPDCTSMCRW